MARKPTRNIKQVATPHGKSRRPIIVLWASIGTVVLLIFALPTVIILFFGMFPSFVAYIVDREKEKHATFCVAGMNLAGTFPYMMDLWINQHNIAPAIETITNVFSLFVMYSAAAFGWVLYYTIPPVVASLISAVNQRKVINLRTRQRELINDWGEGVAYTEKDPITFDDAAPENGPNA